MSVFTEGETNQNTGENQTSEKVSYVKTLVDLKGDKWGDPEIIAKGKIDADNHIKELEAKLEALEKAANQGKKVEDILAKLEEKAAQPTSAKPQDNGGGTSQMKTTPELSEDQIQSLVEKTLTERERNQTVSQNLNQVNSQLDELYGTEAKKTVEDKAKTLGMSVQKLQEIAAESPTAFFTLIGEKAKETHQSFKGTIRTEGVITHERSERNNSYYQEMRKKNPRQFYSAQVQQQMMQDRVKSGANFYN